MRSLFGKPWKKRVKRSYILATALYCAALWWLSAQSHPPKPDVNFAGLDKIVHAALYAGLAGIVSFGLKRSENPPSPRVQFLAPIAFAVLYGTIDEIHQSFVPPRTADAADLLADFLGAGAIQTFLCFYWWRPRLVPQCKPEN